MGRWLRSLILGAIQFGVLWLILGCFHAMQAVLLAVMDLALLGWLLAIAFGLIYVAIAGEVRALWPALVATFVRVGDWLWPIATAGSIASCFVVPDIQKRMFGLPPWDSQAARIGAALGAFVCVIYFSELTSSLGFPPGLKLRSRTHVAIRFKYIALLLAFGTAIAAAAKPQFHWITVPVSISAAIHLTYAALFTMRVARRTFEEFPTAEGSTPATLQGETPFAVHVTDVHLVAPGKKRIEGGQGGNQRLMNFVSLVAGQPPDLLLVTGDLTDHGSQDEYNEAERILQAIQGPTRHSAVLLAPGNHDLGTAYSEADQLLALGRSNFNGPSPIGTNGLLMMRYLEVTAKLHPTIEDCSGQPLVKRLNRLKERDARFEELLKATHERLRSHPFDASALSHLTEAGNESYPLQGGPKAGWPHLLRHPDIFREIYLRSVHVIDLWYEPFPLRARLNDQATEVLIINSVSPDPTMSGSAWGELGEEQLERLRAMLKESDARRCLILVHHSPLRWADESPPARSWADLQRWAFLAFSSEDLHAMLNILKDGAAAGKEIVLFCGHRHGYRNDPSNPAEIPTCRIGRHEGLLVIEGASLAESGTGVVAVIMGQTEFAFRTIDLESTTIAQAAH